MHPDNAAHHLSPEDLSQYYRGELSEHGQGVVEEHLAVCGLCLELAGTIHNFESVWDGWTAQTLGDAYAGEQADAMERLRSALGRIAESVSDLRGRAQDWLERLPRIPMPDLIESAWPLTAEPAAIRTHGSVRPAGALVLHLNREQWAASLALPHGSPWVEVVVSGLEPNTVAPLVVLTPKTAASAILEQAAWFDRPEPAWVAIFRSVPPGDYLAAFELRP